MTGFKISGIGWGGVALAVVLATPAVASAQAPSAPTFAKDIAPIFQEKCEACHRPDSIGPMSLQTYEEVRPWVRSIKARVAERQMPPWHLDKGVGIQKFKNDRSLSDDQIATIVKWADTGAARGDAKDLPAAKAWPAGQGWNFAAMFGQKEPDLVIRSHEFTMPARSQDAWDKRLTPTGITEPRWVRAIEIRPTTVKGRRITHHAIAYLRQEDKDPAANFNMLAPFMEWAVGKEGELMRPNTGKLLLPGSMINWDIHYSAAGEEITNAVELGVYFYPKGQDPKYRNYLALVPAAIGEMDIQPNTISIAQGNTVLRQAARVDPDRLELLYTGSFYAFRRPEVLLDAVLATSGARLTIATINPPPSLVALAESHPDSIRLLGFIGHLDALALQRRCDLLVNIANADPVQVPGKIYEYLGAAAPILHIGDNPADSAASLLSEFGAGWSVAGDSGEIAAQLARLREAKCATGALARPGSAVGRIESSFSWQSLAASLQAASARIAPARSP